jgi:N6-L-threonylcarbamoyladenine synthase
VFYPLSKLVMRVLSVETSCDETSIAVMELLGNRFHIHDHKIASQIEHHRPFGGVVPELATRQHLIHLDEMVEAGLKRCGCSLQELDGFAVTRGPGLASSLLIGLSYVKGLAAATGKPWIGVNHLEGHLYSAFLETGEVPVFPHLGLIVSGGHTQLVAVHGVGEYERLGSTLDDAAGEAFDKVAKMLGLPYPGGPQVELRARTGNAQAYSFPRSMLDSGDWNFSFSGLKTAVRVLLDKNPNLVELPQNVDDVCASFQAAVIEVLVTKSRSVALAGGFKCLSLSGGVSCNQALRAAMNQLAQAEGWTLRVASPVLSTDNAAMIGAAGLLRLARGEKSTVDVDVDPHLKLC